MAVAAAERLHAVVVAFLQAQMELLGALLHRNSAVHLLAAGAVLETKVGGAVSAEQNEAAGAASRAASEEMRAFTSLTLISQDKRKWGSTLDL